jgi:hypothetical protein
MTFTLCLFATFNAALPLAAMATNKNPPAHLIGYRQNLKLAKRRRVAMTEGRKAPILGLCETGHDIGMMGRAPG